jgi:amino acid transporter
MARLSRVMSFRDLVLFNIVAIVGLRWVALAAAGGPSSLTLWLLALLVFFIPQGLAVVRLSALHPGEGGIYVWTREAFGPRHGFIAGWCYWANNVIYYPTLLVALAGFASFIGGESTRYLEGSTTYILIFSLAVLWVALGLNILGLKVGRWVHNFGGLSTWIPGFLLVAFGIVAWIRFGPANPMGLADLLPRTGNLDTLSFFSNICFALAGLELAAVLGDEIREPRRNLQRAVLVSGVFITLIYILGTWALLVAVPVSEISIITGVLQAIDSVAVRVGAGGLGGLMALLLTLGGLGGVGAWLGGSARILFVAGLDRYLPASLGAVHPRWGSPHIALLSQGIVATFFILVGTLGAGPREAYLVLVDTTIIVYFIPYLYMFLSLIRLGRNGQSTVRGASRGNWVYGILGFLAVFLAIILALIPPADSASPILYLLKVVGGTALFIVSAWILYERARRRAPVDST